MFSQGRDMTSFGVFSLHAQRSCPSCSPSPRAHLELGVPLHTPEHAKQMSVTHCPYVRFHLLAPPLGPLTSAGPCTLSPPSPSSALSSLGVPLHGLQGNPYPHRTSCCSDHPFGPFSGSYWSLFGSGQTRVSGLSPELRRLAYPVM